MLKASDGAKVLQLIPVARPAKMYGESFYSMVLYTDEEDTFATARADVLFLAVMDDGSVRPVGVIGLDNYKSMVGDGELCFIEDEGYPVVRAERGSSGIHVDLAID